MLLRRVILMFSFLFANDVSCAKIMGIFNSPSQSHFSVGKILMESLAERGHDVTFFSPYNHDSRFQNFKSVRVPRIVEIKKSYNDKILLANTFVMVHYLWKSYTEVNEAFMETSEVKNLISSNATFDLIILDLLFSEPLLGLAHKFGASVIINSAYGSNSITNRIVGNSAPSSYVPNMFPPASDKLTFGQRLGTVLYKILNELELFMGLNVHEPFIRKYFPNSPSLQDLVRNVSLVFVNSHDSIESPRPYVPTMIPIGGIHLKEPKELVGKLRIFADSAKKGLVYCSFGSLVKSSELNSAKINIILDTFSKLSPDLKVMWKYDGTINPDLVPSNVMISEWFPQMDILAHRNTKLFISHCGMMSVMEAVYNAVPIVGVPFFGDQHSNLKHALQKQIAVELNFKYLTELALRDAILEVLNNPHIYAANAQKYSELFKDQPMKPLEKAIYWIEYVLKHEGAHHLKVRALELPLYKYYLVDVFALILGSLVIIFYVLQKSLTLLFKFVLTKIKKEKIS